MKPRTIKIARTDTAKVTEVISVQKTHLPFSPTPARLGMSMLGRTRLGE